MTPMEIKKFRGSLGLSQIEFAKSIGVDRTTVCSWEKGHKFPQPKNLKKMLEQNMDETNMSEYIAGFDAGYDCVLREIERYKTRHDYEPRATWPLDRLLAHLKYHLKTKDEPDRVNT